MTGGSSIQGSGLISRASELESLRSDRERLRTKLEEAKEALTAIRRETEGIQYELQIAQEDLGELNQSGAVGAEQFDGFELLDRERARNIFRRLRLGRSVL